MARRWTVDDLETKEHGQTFAGSGHCRKARSASWRRRVQSLSTRAIAASAGQGERKSARSRACWFRNASRLTAKHNYRLSRRRPIGLRQTSNVFAGVLRGEGYSAVGWGTGRRRGGSKASINFLAVGPSHAARALPVVLVPLLHLAALLRDKSSRSVSSPRLAHLVRKAER